MLRAGALRHLTLSLVLAVTAALGTAGCILAPFPEPVAIGPPVIIEPRPYPVYRGGYRGHYHRGPRSHWR